MSDRSGPGGLGALSPFRRRWEWDVSAVVNREVQIDALLMMGGPQGANILENYEKNAKRIKRFQMFQGLMIAVLVGFSAKRCCRRNLAQKCRRCHLAACHSKNSIIDKDNRYLFTSVSGVKNFRSSN